MSNFKVSLSFARSPMLIHNLHEQSSAMHLFLAELRDKTIQKDRERFRQNLKKIGVLIGYEISKVLKYEEQDVYTPLGIAKAKIASEHPVIIGILRASLPFFNGFLEIFPQAECGFIGAYRISETKSNIKVQTDYVASGVLEDEVLILTDPMLASGTSIVDAIELLQKNGKPREIHIASVVAAPEGINYINDRIKTPVHLWTCAIDEKLNDQAYIVPGLGDAGDLSFGPKI